MGRTAGLVALVSLVMCSAGTAGGEPVSAPAVLQVGVTTLHLVDTGRADAWQPSTPRELVVTIHYPAVHAESQPLADWLLPNLPSTVLAARAHVDAQVNAEAGTLPVVLYSPGASFPAQAGASLAEDLAASGYAVVSIGDTHGALPATVFPDGHVELYDTRNLTEPLAEIMRISTQAREGDIRFVLDTLTAMTRGNDRDADGKQLPAGLGAALDPTRVGMFGHSLGGIMTVYADSRVRAGVDLDGYAKPADLAPDLVADPRRPMLFLLSDLADPAPRRSSLNLMCANRSGWTRQLVLAGAQHWTFSDLEYLPRQLAETPALAKGFGTIDPDRAHTVISTYVTAMFDRYLRGLPAPVLDAPVSEFAEVTDAP